MTPEALKEAYELLKTRDELKRAAASIKDSEQISITDDQEFVLGTFNGEAKIVIYNAMVMAVAEIETKLFKEFKIEIRYYK